MARCRGVGTSANINGGLVTSRRRPAQRIHHHPANPSYTIAARDTPVKTTTRWRERLSSASLPRSPLLYRSADYCASSAWRGSIVAAPPPPRSVTVPASSFAGTYHNHHYNTGHRTSILYKSNRLAPFLHTAARRRFTTSSHAKMSEEPVNTRTMAPERLVDNTMEKPLLDDRTYRVIRLPNKLEALLIHDPETDKASASLDVNVGSFSDADDMPGMAHAVEHLLFMGTEKVRWSCMGFLRGWGNMGIAC